MSEERQSSIFILKNKATSLKSVEKFLTNRGWSVSTGISIKELIAYLIQKQPDLILIPADFSQQKNQSPASTSATSFSSHFSGLCRADHSESHCFIG